jgi:2-methylcitrate dehydratase PrpD
VGPTLALAEWIAAVGPREVPPDRLDQARLWMLDGLGCALFGHATEWGGIACRLALRSPGPARLLGRRESVDPPAAALANGVLVHSFDFDEYHPGAKLHATAAVLPAALAAAERADASGADLLLAYLVGVETAVRVALAAGPNASRLRGWHLTGTCGAFGAAAACARLLGLTERQTAWALGLAGTQASGLWAFNADGAMSKRLHPGRAAQAGLLAAELAALGFSGPTSILEAEDGGFWRATSDAPEPERATRELGRAWECASIALKPYPCCATAHSSVDAALELYRRGVRGSEVRRVRVLQSRVGLVQTGLPYVPSTVLQAQMSLRYCVAAALTDGRLGVAQFAPDRIADPRLADLAARVDVAVDAELDRLYPESRPGVVEVERLDGGRLGARVDEPRGSPARPLTRDEAVAKFREQARTALADAGVERLLRAVDGVAGLRAVELAAAAAGDAPLPRP